MLPKGFHNSLILDDKNMNLRDLPNDFTIRDEAHGALILALISLERKTTTNPLWSSSPLMSDSTSHFTC